MNSLLITTPQDMPDFQRLLGDGSDFGIHLSYAEQPSPDGLAQAFIIGRDFIGQDDVCLILGDSIFYGSGLTGILKNAMNTVRTRRKAVIMGYPVQNPGQAQTMWNLNFHITMCPHSISTLNR